MRISRVGQVNTIFLKPRTSLLEKKFQKTENKKPLHLVTNETCISSC